MNLIIADRKQTVSNMLNKLQGQPGSYDKKLAYSPPF
jgi:hypothetical protein